MTREEAIKLIDTHTVCFYNEIDSPTLQALHLAIESLQTDVVRCKACKWHMNDYMGEWCGKLSEHPWMKGRRFLFLRRTQRR